MTGIAIIDALARLGKLAFWSILPARPPQGDESCPPVIRFRYERDQGRDRSVLEAAISSSRHALDWHLASYEALLIIEPKRLPRYSDEHGLLGRMEAARVLAQREPEYGRRCHLALAELVEDIRSYLEDHSEVRRPGAGARPEPE